MAIKIPTPAEVRSALADWLPARKLQVDSGWDTRGRKWSYGIRGAVVHWWAGEGDGGQQWMHDGEGGAYPYCNAVIRYDGRVVIESALSAWGSGAGGPWNKAGVPKDAGHLMLWQWELEGGMNGIDNMTDAQWQSLARGNCALRQVAGVEAFPNFQRIIRHKDWTDGTGGVSKEPLPTLGRKQDVSKDIGLIRREAKDRWLKKYPKA